MFHYEDESVQAAISCWVCILAILFSFLYDGLNSSLLDV